MGNIKYNIGIGIITKNRRHTFLNTYKNIKKFMPPNSKLVIVDDGSDVPLTWANKINKESQGIAKASNNALALMQDCKYIFLFNDDVYPIVDKWWEPYINSKENHLSLSFEKCADGQQLALTVYVIEKKPNNVWVYASTNGCMMFITNKVLQTVGGLNTDFGTWGMEHVEYSRRIYNAGLTSNPYMDVANGIDMFYSYDYHKSIESSVPEETRKQCIINNIPIFKATKLSKEYIEYN